MVFAEVNLICALVMLNEKKKIVRKASVFTGGLINFEFKGW